MIIELFGVPGCGKSTYSQYYIKNNSGINVLDMYLYNDSRIVRNMNKLVLCISFWIKHPREARNIFKIFSEIHFKSRITAVKMWFYLYTILNLITIAQRKYASKTVIMDEGINQVLWGLLYNSNESKSQVFQLQQMLIDYMGNYVCHIVVNNQVIKNRLLNRFSSGGSELQQDIRKDVNALDRAIDYSNDLVDGIIKCGIAVRTINNT